MLQCKWQSVAQLTELKASRVEQYNCQHQSNKDTLGQHKTKSPNDQSQSAKATGTYGDNHDGHKGEAAAQSDHTPA